MNWLTVSKGTIAFVAIGSLLGALVWGIWHTQQRWRTAHPVLKPMSSPSLRPDRLPEKRLRPKPQRPPADYAIPVLCYHDFRDKPSQWAITPQRFEAHLKALKAMGFTFLTVSEAVDLLSGRWTKPVPKRAVVITIDDGFRSAYTVAFPLLRQYGAKATVCVYTAWIGKTRGALTWDELCEMVQSGIIEVASHTISHPNPRRMRRKLRQDDYRNRMARELMASQQELERQLGTPINGLAYPGGYVDGTLKALAQKAGYRWALTINPKPIVPETDPYALPRFGISSETTLKMVQGWVTCRPTKLVRQGRSP